MAPNDFTFTVGMHEHALAYDFDADCGSSYTLDGDMPTCEVCHQDISASRELDCEHDMRTQVLYVVCLCGHRYAARPIVFHKPASVVTTGGAQ